MNSLVLLTAWTLSFTAPDSAVSDTLPNGPTVGPTILSYGQLWGWPRYGGVQPQYLLTIPLSGQEGKHVTVTVDLTGVWTLYVVAVDVNGDASLPSNMVTVGGTTDVLPPLWALPPVPLYYDLQGRRVTWPPPHAGLYFKRLGGKVVKITYFP